MNTPSPLGICIPTYKRPDQLEACVRSIIASARDQAVPIFISDDAADDTNVEVVSRLTTLYPHIIHDRNPVNLGIDRNILKAVDLCTCPYAWLMGEDDRMLPEGIPTVLRVIGTPPRDIPFIYVNYVSVDETLTIVLHEQSLGIPRDCTLSAEAFFPEMAWSIGFIGGCIVNRHLWGKVNRAPYIGTYFAHAGIILEYLKGRQLQLVSAPLVMNRCGAARIFTWTDSAFEVMYGWSRMTHLLKPIYGNEACTRSNTSMDRAHGTGSMLWYGYLRADHAYNLTIYRRHVSPANHSRLHKMGALLIATTPAPVFQLVRWILTHFRRRTRRSISGYGVCPP